MSNALLAKARIKPYTRQDGTFVRGHEARRRQGQAQATASKRTKDAGEQWRRKLRLASASRDDNFLVSIEAPPVLKEELGLLQRLELTSGRLSKILSDHPDLPMEAVINLPELVADPLYVYVRDKSAGHGHGETNVVVEITTKSGNPVLVGIARGEIRTITPRHDRETVSGHDHLLAEIGRGKILYARNKEALTKVRAVQGAINPGTIPVSPSEGGLVRPRKGKILFREDIVNAHGEEYLVKSWLAKARVRGFTRKNGVYVRPHDRRTAPAAKPLAAPVHHHPRLGEKGEQVVVESPTRASHQSTWHSPSSVATFVPDGDTPPSLNGVPMARWRDHPTTTEGWDYVDGTDEDLDEPPLHLPPGKKLASGVVIEEPDGRVWLIAPTNGFGGYEASFPKGTAEPELSLQANAIKECWEETGLKVEITGFVGDFPRTTSIARMYRARRVGGTPAAMGWESQALHLVPKTKLYDYLNMWSDHPVAESIGAGESPELVQS